MTTAAGLKDELAREQHYFDHAFEVRETKREIRRHAVDAAGDNKARARLKAMAETADGFEIARRDLEIRGPGEFLGARQSGAALLRFADLATDTPLLDWARALAPVMLDQHAEMARQHTERWLGGKSAYLKA